MQTGVTPSHRCSVVTNCKILVVQRLAFSLVPRPAPFFVLRFAFSIIHGGGRARKTGKYGGPVVHSDVASAAGPPVFRIMSAMFPQSFRTISAASPQCYRLEA